MTDGKTFYFEWEVKLMEWLQEHLGGTAVSYLSVFGEEMMLVALLGFVYWSYNKRIGRTMGLCILEGLVLDSMLKNIFTRLRPYFVHKQLNIYRLPEPDAPMYDISAQGYSFPSVHSTNSVGLFGGFASRAKKPLFTVLAILIPLLVGFSGVVVGAHYPTDVLAGWAVGGLMIFLTVFMEDRLHPAVMYGIFLAIGLPGLFFCKSADYYTGYGLLAGFSAAILFEERFVKFEDTRRPMQMILRLAGGAVVYFLVNSLLKLPFSHEFLDSGSRAALLVRCARYAVVAFADFGLYPLAFRLAPKKQAAQETTKG